MSYQRSDRLRKLAQALESVYGTHPMVADLVTESRRAADREDAIAEVFKTLDSALSATKTLSITAAFKVSGTAMSDALDDIASILGDTA